MKHIKKIVASLLAVALLVSGLTMTVHADNNDKGLTLETNIDKTLEIPLTLKGTTDNFYINGNINPGDVMTATVVFKNTSKEDIQVRISDVTDQLNTTKSTALLEILELTIDTDGSTIYKGSHKAVTSPLTQWITLAGGASMKMNVKVEFPKYEADNSFQGAEMKVKYVFEARADVPLDETISTTPENIKTGDESETSINGAAGIFLVASLGLVAIFIASLIVIKKKRKDRD